MATFVPAWRPSSFGGALFGDEIGAFAPATEVSVAIGQAAEADTALDITPVTSTTIGQAVEADEALDITPLAGTAARDTATYLESLVDAETDARVTATALEALVDGEPTARDTASYLEVLQNFQPIAVDTATYLEAFGEFGDVAARVAAAYLEVLVPYVKPIPSFPVRARRGNCQWRR